METIGEIIPFAKEILNQKPSRGMLKIYMFGTTLAMLGLVGGLMETVCQQFAEDDVADVHTPLVDATHLMVTRRRSSANRLHAS
uniref:G0/G1 switch 2 n=1 Tax=Sphaeramia orbicularis TaxID=375764 RepID=A0A672YPJ2_9TELE